MATAHDPVDTHKNTSEEEDSRTRLIAAFSHAAFSNSRASAFDFMRSETFLALTSNVAGYDWLAKALQSAEPPLSDLISFLATKVREQSSSAGVAQAASQGGSSVIVEMNPFRIAWGSSIPPVRPVRHDDLDAILEALDKALPAKKPLKMVLFRGIVDWEMMHSSFRVFDVEGSALGDTGMQTLSDVLCRREFRLLAVLNLRGNSIDDMGAQVLAKAFFHLRFLTLVDVSGNSIGTKGAKALAEQLLLVNRAVLLPPAWRVPLSVPLLDLSGNFFGAEDAEALIVQLELLYVPWLVPHSHCISLLNSASVCSLVQAGSEGQEDRTLLRIKIDAPLAPPECDASSRDLGSSDGGVNSSEGETAAPLTHGAQPTQAAALESRAPPTADPGAAGAADAVDAKAGPIATVAEPPLPGANAVPPRRTASVTAADAGASTPSAVAPSALTRTQGAGTAELRVPAAATSSVADVDKSESDSAHAASAEMGLSPAATAVELAALDTPPLLPLAAATDARGEDAETAGGASPVAPAAFDAAARDAVLAFLNGGLQSVVPTAEVRVEYASSGAFTATARVNPDDLGDAERLAARFGVRGSFNLEGDPHVHQATFLTPEFLASARRDLQAPEPSAAFAYSLASKELHRCVEGVTLEYWGGADGHVKLRARVPEGEDEELERAQAVVRRILLELCPPELVGLGTAAIIVEAVPGSETGLALPKIQHGKVSLKSRPPAGDLNNEFISWSLAVVEDRPGVEFELHDNAAPRPAAAAAAPRPAVAAAPVAAARQCHCGRPFVDGVRAGENGAMAISLSAYIQHGGKVYAISTGHGLPPSPGDIHANSRKVELRSHAAGGDVATPLRAVHCIDPGQHQLNSFIPFQGSKCTDAMPCAIASLPPKYTHTASSMIADVSIFELLLPDADPDRAAKRALDLQGMTQMSLLARKARVGHRLAVVGLPFWGEFKGDVLFYGKTSPTVIRSLYVCGYSVKCYRVRRGLETVQVSLVNYVARSDHETGCPLAPQNGDSGGAVMQQSGDDRRLHSFVRARAHAGDGADRETYYTLTPAHFALQQVKELLLDDDDEGELVFYDA